MIDRPPRPSRSGRLLDSQTWEALRRAGFSQQQLYDDQPFGPVLSAYSRADAIRDGVLIDLSVPPWLPLARQAGIGLPVAITAAAFAQTVGDRPPVDQGRLSAVLVALREAIGRLPRDRPTDRVHFSVQVVTADRPPWAVPLWCLCGPGDNAEPVLTVMLPEED